MVRWQTSGTGVKVGLMGGKCTGYEENTSHIRTSIHDYVHKVFPSLSLLTLSQFLFDPSPCPRYPYFLQAYLFFSILLHIISYRTYIYTYRVEEQKQTYIRVCTTRVNTPPIYTITPPPPQSRVFVLRPAAGHCIRQFRLGQTV